MSDRSDLAAYWRSRLAASEEQCLHGSPHLSWLRRMYIRIYRFLLSQYGEMQPTTASADNPPSAAAPLVDHTDHHGRPPKAPGKIQAILKDIHVANDRLDKPGPLVKGVPAGEWIVVATRRDRRWPHRSAGWLRRNGIPARVVGHGRSAVVEVRSDAVTAIRLLDAGGESLRVRPGGSDKYPAAVAHPIVGGGVVGGCFGMIFGFFIMPVFAFMLFDSNAKAEHLPALVLTFVLGGYAVGFLLGAWLAWRDVISRMPSLYKENHEIDP